MPVEFLTDEQAETYGKFAEEPTRPELERFFFLDDMDRDLIVLRRTKHHQLGFALQMCTVRYVGLFLGEDPLDVPWSVVEHLAEQLGIKDAVCVKRYTERRQTVYDHAWEIRDAYDYHAYEDHEMGRKFRAFLHGQAWTAHLEGPKALFDHTVGWLCRNRVLLPGVSMLARQVAEVRAIADKRPHATVTRAARRAAKHLQGAIAAEEQMGREGRTDEVLAQVTEVAARLLPTKEAVGRAAANGGVLRLLDQAHWAEGWLHQLTRRAARRVDKDTLDNMAWLLGEILADWSRRAAETVAADREKGHGPPATAEVTRVLVGPLRQGRHRESRRRDGPRHP
nr:DUF4158 domain-containing protein [Streptomyces sp. GbtcB7]